MENYSEINQRDLSNFETELSGIIQEVEENKKKLEFLEKENEQLRLKNANLEKNEINYINTLKQNTLKIQELEKQTPIGLSEKDLAEVMLDAKRVANDIVQKAKEEVKAFEHQKQAALNSMRQEGQLLREDIVNFKMKADQDLNQWIESLEVLIGSSEQ
ncbi:hypothetical protein [Lactococcus petauri]|uniref:Uncharacterized protein n=1 Tax=Lactococcus petauri TaxID=1940789 RepID=A0A252CCR7_9LACT|nr:hypothetical protein [Lactococcus petauri]OUK04367.1 hypothetical protein BZZ03_05020 [Lactococcus petauri]